ncbi:MAG: hypothetical protein HQL41_19940, partial [Alphaproteobacteria bacterium]|nr:hypothetical protein [Alphaproteobacteria bacterium]
MMVIAAYQIADDDPRGRGSCAACGHTNNHKGGVVLGFDGGHRASIGRVCCGKAEYGFEFKKVVNSFDADTSRVEALRRVLAAIEHLAPAAAHIAALPHLPQVQALQELRKSFERKFGRLYQWLQIADGELKLMMTVADDDKMIARRKRRDAKAERFIERYKASHDQREPDPAEVRAH